MMRISRILLPVIALLLAFCLAGCGAEKPKESADKAVLGWAEMYAYGMTDNLSATGMTKEQSDQISEKVIGDMLKAFSAYPLSEENVQKITTEYITKLQAAMAIQTKIKKDDAEHPIVEVSANVIDQQATAQMAQTNEDLAALGTVLGALRSQGVTDEQIKGDADFQKAVMECVNSYIDEIRMKGTQTFDVECAVDKGEGDKAVWAPKDPQALMKFITGM